MNRIRKLTCRFAALYISIIMILGQLPAAAYAADLPVQIQRAGTGTAGMGVSALRITAVDAPVPGTPLDTSATVTSAEGAQWEIPVIWVDETGSLAEGIAEDRTYFPVLAFSVPGEYTVLDGSGIAGSYQIVIDDSLSDLFGEDVLTVWLAEYDITLIFPGNVNLRATDVISSLTGAESDAYSQGSSAYASNVYASVHGAVLTAVPVTEAAASVVPSSGALSVTVPAPAASGNENQTPSAADDPEPGGQEEETVDPLERLVNIHCSRSALDRLGMAQLKTLVDLIINRLQPQAVNLLTEKFPAFQKAASAGELGKEIGLYVYYQKGDKDGISEHEDAADDALAYVQSGQIRQTDQDIRFRYFIGVDASSFCLVNEQGETVLNLDDEAAAETLENTIVHEMLHAFNDDYNRVGMCGAVRPEDLYISDNLTGEAAKAAEEEADRLYAATVWPGWFAEGLASAVENVYQYRRDTFQLLRYDRDLAEKTEQFSENGVLKAYLTMYSPAGNKKSALTFDLEDAGKKEDSLDENVSNTPAKYTTGYLACLYLGELAAYGKNYAAVRGTGAAFSSEAIRMGINTILERLHNGETMDEVISDISGGRYQSTNAFEEQFIKGKGTGTGDEETWSGDADTQLFCTDFLNYMLSIDNNDSFKDYANGSILFDFETDFTTPLDRTKEASSDLYVIIDSNELTDSTVSNDAAMKDGGKSRSGSGIQTTGNGGNGIQTIGTNAGSTASGTPAMPVTLAAKTEAEETGVRPLSPAEAEEADQSTEETGVRPLSPAEAEEADQSTEETGVRPLSPAVPEEQDQGSARSGE